MAVRIGPNGVGSADTVAAVLADEIGHNCGLPHVTAANNLMTPGQSGGLLDATQIVTIRSRTGLVRPFDGSPPAILSVRSRRMH